MTDANASKLPMSALGFPNMDYVSTVLQSIQTVGQSFSEMMIRAHPKSEMDFINRLPPEAVSEILRFAMTPSKEPVDINPRVIQSTPVFSAHLPISPFHLTQVCRRWRHIAQNTKQLWRSISIIHPEKHLIHRIALWMTFVGQHPLDVCFHQSATSYTDEIETTHEIIDLLAQRSQQWSTVEFHFHQDTLPPSLVAQFNKISANTSSILKSATISHWFRFSASEEDVGSTWESLNKTRSLKKLNWYSADGVSHPSSSTVQSLTINGISARELIQGVKLCPNLQDLDVQVHTGAPFDENELKHVKPITQNHLQHIALKGDSRDIKAFLHSFTFPELFSVELNYLDLLACITLWSLLVRSQCTLTKLVLGVQGIQDDTLADWFELGALQSLETMAIAGAEATDAAFLMLTCPPVRGNRSSYFEKLKYLSLSNCSPNMDQDVFLRMLGSRLFTPTGEAPRVELMTAAFEVHDKTNKLRMYEDMCLGLVKAEFLPGYKNWRKWNDRSVVIRQR